MVKNGGLMLKQMKMGTISLTYQMESIKLMGVWVDSESKWYPFVVSFKVQDGAVINPDVLKFDLTEKGPNTNGSVMKDGQPVSDVWVSAHTVTGEETVV